MVDKQLYLGLLLHFAEGTVCLYECKHGIEVAAADVGLLKFCHVPSVTHGDRALCID